MTINYLILLIISFLLSMLSLLVYVALNFFLKINLLKKVYKKYKNFFLLKNIFIKLLQLAIVASIFLITVFFPQFNVSIINNDYKLVSVFYIPLLLTIGMLFDWWMSLLLAITMVIGISIGYSIYMTNEDLFFSNTIFQILTILVCLLSIGINKLFNKFLSNRFVIISSLLTFGFTLLLAISLLINQKTLLYMVIIEIPIVWVVYLLTYQISYVFLQTIKKTSIITENVTYEKKYFFNYEKSFKKITEYIKSNNTNFGLIIVFNIVNFDMFRKSCGNNVAKKMQNEFLDKIIETVKLISPLLFMTENNNYACFVPINLIGTNLEEIYSTNSNYLNDKISLIQKHLHEIPKQVKYKNQEFKTDLGAYGAIYGLHSCDISELIQLCYFTKRKTYSSRKNNLLEIYNPNLIGINKSLVTVQNETSKIFKKDFQIKFKKIKNDLIQNNIYSPDISYVDNLLFNIDEIKTYAKENNDYIPAIRTIAMQVLTEFTKKIKNYDKSLVIVDYPVEFLSNINFNLGNLKTKLDFLNIAPEQIIFRFDINNLNKNSVSIKYLNILKSMKFKILISDINILKNNFLKQIIPDYIFIKNLDWKKLSPQNIDSLKKFEIKVIS